MLSRMSTVASRKYPRIPLDQVARLEVQVGDGRTLTWATMDAALRTASCEGVGLKIRHPGLEPIIRHRKSVLHFRVDNVPVLIPGRVAWSATRADGDMDLGIRFDLALAQASSRERYSSWIVASIVGLRDYVSQHG